jgi:hypothetical protein
VASADYAAEMVVQMCGQFQRQTRTSASMSQLCEGVN